MNEQLLKEKLDRGIIVLRVDYFKTTGKWYTSAVVELELAAAEEVQFDHRRLLNLIDSKQKQLGIGAYREFVVVISEHHYANIAGYHNFFTRMYLP